MPTPDISPKDENHSDLSNGEIAWLIKILWASLQAPGWTNKTRKDLEKLGEALYSGKSLKELDDSLYDRIFPHLVIVAKHLGKALRDSPLTSKTSPTTEEKVSLDGVRVLPPNSLPGDE
jgi:hypothetical protein